MKYAFICSIALLSVACTSFAQRPITEGEINSLNRLGFGAVEGQSMKHRGVSLTVLANVSVAPVDVASAAGMQAQSASNPASAETLGRVGPYEITRPLTSKKRALEAASVQASTKQALAVVSATPTNLFASTPYLGVVMYNDSQEVGLISPEITLRFKNGQVSSQYRHLSIKELIAGSGLYVLTVNSLSDWLLLLPQLESDPSVSFVEAQIVSRMRQVR